MIHMAGVLIYIVLMIFLLLFFMSVNDFIFDLSKYSKKIINCPLFAVTYAMEVDRIVRLDTNIRYGITFSARQISKKSLENIKKSGNKQVLVIFDDFSLDDVRENTIYHAEEFASKNDVNSAIQFAYLNASGEEVDSLNILYANYKVKNEELRLYFLNKYLSGFDRVISLYVNDGQSFFNRIHSLNKYEKIDGPLVTIIMPAFNAENTIEKAVNSIINQSWKNLQIIIVDDASNDSTLIKAKEIEKLDKRVLVLCTTVNVGPYVCRNMGVLHARGEYLTVHDADDWAFPDRIERQVKSLLNSNAVVCTGSMLRMNSQGKITRSSRLGKFSSDGYLRLCFVSCMIQTNVFRNQLGAWDSVRVSGDAEMLERISILNLKTIHVDIPLMICLDHDGSLTNNSELGLNQDPRAEYSNSFKLWHQAEGSKKLDIMSINRAFSAPVSIQIDPKDIKKVLAKREKQINIIAESKLFDTQWFKAKYPQVDESALEPIEYYLIYGVAEKLDPNPNFNGQFYLDTRGTKVNPLLHHLTKDQGPKVSKVLRASEKFAQLGEYHTAIALAERYLSPDLVYTANILKANQAIAHNETAMWLDYFNTYLKHFKVEPICLDGVGGVFNRLACKPLPKVTGGSLVTVIMPAWNAEKTLRKAANSILMQTWQNIELIIVDDASDDSTWMVMKEIAESDTRVKIFRNKVNVGPYVSKNIGLMNAKGDWITGHDADDWAHPQRLENHLAFVLRDNECDASLTYMVRMESSGIFTKFANIGSTSIDGIARISSISAMFKSAFIKSQLGFWDSVRFGADSEMIARATKILGSRFKTYPTIGMVCLDLEGSLTNDNVNGIRTETGLSPLRVSYRNSWNKVHSSDADLFIDFPQIVNPFHDNEMHVVSYETQIRCIT